MYAGKADKIASSIKLTVAIVALLAIGIGVAGAQCEGCPKSPEDYRVKQFWYQGKLVDKIIVPGRPPQDYRARAVQLPQMRPAQDGYPPQQVEVLPNSPALDWSYGCAPTSAAMIFGYYDNVLYPSMYSGPTNGGVFPMTNASWGEGECPLSATHQGYDGLLLRGHVDDYWIADGDPGPDPFLIYGWPEHTHADCTADFMGTNQSEFGMSDGATAYYFNNDGTPLEDFTGDEPTGRDGCHGMRLFAESRGYTVQTNFNQYIWGYGGNTEGFTFTDFQREIDAGRPVMILVTGHAMVGFGYDSTQTPPLVYIHDTWDHADHEMEWAGSYNGMQHYAVSVFRVMPPPPPTITIMSPRDGELIHVGTPTIIARIVSESANYLVDESAGVDPNSIVLKLDGVEVTDCNFDNTTGLLTWTPSTPLAQTSHMITLDASDNDGKAADQATCNFRIVVPTIDDGLHMFSLPYTYAADQMPTPSELLGLAENEIKLARWWPEDSAYNKHHIYPDDFASFLPPDARGPTPVVASPPAGLGYFLSIPRRAQLNITGQALDQVDSYQIRLSYTYDPPQGWNMIGCPFTRPVDWGSVYFITNGQRQSLREAVAAGVTDGVLFGYHSTASGGYYDFPTDPFTAIMEPFEGYWVHVWEDTTLLIYSPQVGVSRTDKHEEQAQTPDSGWQVQIVATAGADCDPANYVGVHGKASDNYDPGLDIGKPPPVVNTVRAYIPHYQWQRHSGAYARDLRAAQADKHSWDVEVSCPLSDTEVTVQWPRLNASVPQEWQFILEDLDSGQQVFMRTSNGYTFTTGSSGEIRHLRLVAYKDKGDSVLTVSGVSAQAAPGGGAVITYALSQPGTVTGQIRNISGILIRQFAEQRTSGGQVEMLLWDGRNSHGSRVPAGTYLARITARNSNGQTVQAIRPFTISP